jgi:hypothetical protein
MSTGQIPRLKRTTSTQLLMDAGKEVAKSVVVAKAAQTLAVKTGIAAAASSAGFAAWGSALLAARKVHPEYLDPVSSNQINQDPEYCMNVHALVTFAGQVKLEDVKDDFRFYVKHFDHFREKVVRRQWLWPYWSPVYVDVDEHVKMDETELGHASMCEVIAESLSEGLDPNKALWKVTVYPNFICDDGSKGSALLIKYHHCIGDGFAMLKLLMSRTTAVPDPPPRQKKTKGAVASVHSPGQIGNLVGDAASSLAKLLTIQDDPPSAIKAKKLLSASDRRICMWQVAKATVPLIKKASKAHGFTLNDFVMAALSQALNDYQKHKGQMSKEDPLVVVWVALKPIPEAMMPQDLNHLESPSNSTLGSVYLRLPVIGDMTPLGRAQEISNRISAMKSSPEPMLSRGLVGTVGLLPTAISSQIWDVMAYKVSMSVSNVPGPPADIKVCGANPSGFSFWVPPVGTISTFVTIMSFGEGVTLSMAMDNTLFSEKDSAYIGDKFSEALDVLCNEAAVSKL